MVQDCDTLRNVVNPTMKIWVSKSSHQIFKQTAQWKELDISQQLKMSSVHVKWIYLAQDRVQWRTAVNKL